jgi:hypothetical protein
MRLAFNAVSTNKNYYMALSKMSIGFLRDFTSDLLLLYFAFTGLLGEAPFWGFKLQICPKTPFERNSIKAKSTRFS